MKIFAANKAKPSREAYGTGGRCLDGDGYAKYTRGFGFCLGATGAGYLMSNERVSIADK